VTLFAPSLHPSREITVNLDDPQKPAVFVVSTIRFVHYGHASRRPIGRSDLPAINLLQHVVRWSGSPCRFTLMSL
jgi:hypothetical protein